MPFYPYVVIEVSADCFLRCPERVITLAILGQLFLSMYPVICKFCLVNSMG